MVQLSVVNSGELLVKYKTICAKRDPKDQLGGKLASDLQRALLNLEKEGWDAVSMLPVQNSGQTVSVIVVGRLKKVTKK